MEVSALANETLLAVFSLLTPEDLLRCRAVCHRWASLAQDPTVWSGQNVDSKKCSLKLLTAILRFAPCLGFLQVNFGTAPISPLWSTLLSTACAISGLDFVISTADAVYAALVISRHASLGRLKMVYLNVAKKGKAQLFGLKRSLYGLLMQISHTQGLEEISFYAEGVYMDGAVAEFDKRMGLAPATAPVSPSLKSLWTSRLNYIGQLLLQWHADTLEDVRAVEPSENGADVVALLLSRLPRLRKLSCPPLDNMPTLLQCPSLKRLELYVDPIQNFDDSLRLLRACAYLRDAVGTQLLHLILSPMTGAFSSVKRLLLCLEGKEGTAVALRSLRLDFTHESRQGEVYALYQQPLVEALHRLRLLTLLDLDSMPTTALLQALDGRAVPELTQLLVGDAVSPDCGHQFIHSEALRTLLRNYPWLHVIMKDAQFCDGCRCPFCKEGCHAVPDRQHCMLFGHEAGACCGVPHGRYCYDQVDQECIAFRISSN